MSEELKPCPFCGEEELLLLPHASRAIQTIVQCKGCLMGGPIAAWNRRDKIIEVMRAILADMPTPCCEHLHHSKKDFHAHNAACPVVERLLVAITKANAMLAASNFTKEESDE